MTPMSWKRWVLSVLGLLFGLQLLVVGINVAFDPLWCFGWYGPWNDLCEGFDERQQKTDRMLFLPFSYDTLLLGSSRVTYMTPLAGTPHAFFNNSVSSMKPREYGPFLAFARSCQNRPFGRVLIGIDFFGTNARLRSRDTFASPEAYWTRAQSPLFRWRMATGLDALQHSLEAAALNAGWKNPDGDYRRRELSRIFLPPEPEKKRRDVDQQKNDYKKNIYGDYRYESFREGYQSLLKNHPSTDFLVFTTPESAVLLRVLVEEQRFDAYAQWLRELVDVFGSIWNFMYVNRIATDMAHYKDAHHFSPTVGHYILQRLLGAPYQGPADFGVRVTSANLEEHLAWVHKQFDALVASPDTP